MEQQAKPVWSAHLVSQSAGCCCAGAPNAMVATVLTSPRIMPQAREVDDGERENDGEGLYTAGVATIDKIKGSSGHTFVWRQAC
jgi:hypothetical protein